MLRLLIAALLLVPATGCLGPSLEPAPLPPDGEIFTLYGLACSFQQHPNKDLLVTYPDGTLYHLNVEALENRTDVPTTRSIPLAEAERVVQDANRTPVLNLTFYATYMGPQDPEDPQTSNGYVIKHAEKLALPHDTLLELRRRVTEADLHDRDRVYPGSLVDGCSHTLSAWTDGAYPVVLVTNDGGPEPLRAFIQAHRDHHAIEP